MFASTLNCPELLASGGDYVKSIVDWAVQRTWFNRWFSNNVSVSGWHDFQMHSRRECTFCLLRFQFGQRWQYTCSVCTGNDCAHNSHEKTKTKKTKNKTKTKQNRKPLREHCLTVEMSLTAGDLDDCLQRLIKLRLMLKIYRKIILPDDRQLHKHDLTKAGGPYGLRTS